MIALISKSSSDFEKQLKSLKIEPVESSSAIVFSLKLIINQCLPDDVSINNTLYK